jgi:hypothetical protein
LTGRFRKSERKEDVRNEKKRLKGQAVVSFLVYKRKNPNLYLLLSKKKKWENLNGAFPISERDKSAESAESQAKHPSSAY